MDYKTIVDIEPRDFGLELRYSDDQAEVINGMAEHLWRLSPYNSDRQIISLADHLDDGGKALIRRLLEEVDNGTD